MIYLRIMFVDSESQLGKTWCISQDCISKTIESNLAFYNTMEVLFET